MYFTNTDIEQEIRDNLAELRESNYPEDMLNEWADSAVPVYTSDIIKDWAEMPSVFDDVWQEAFTATEEGTTIVKLMTIDLYNYYQNTYTRIYNEILEEEEDN